MINFVKQAMVETLAQTELAKLEEQFGKNKQAQELLELEQDYLKKQILGQMGILFPEQDSAKWVNPETGGQFTRILANRTKFDIGKFMVALPAKLLDKVTKRAVDGKAYEAAVGMGLIDNAKMIATGAVEVVPEIRLRYDGGKQADINFKM